MSYNGLLRKPQAGSRQRRNGYASGHFSENENPFPCDIADWLYLLYGLTDQEIAVVEEATE
ncbi:MAG: hypothetical protein IH831_01065 [Planctomycetes bacterium]|nr:hypothetical protein [Planctomycetota bacterium]